MKFTPKKGGHSPHTNTRSNSGFKQIQLGGGNRNKRDGFIRKNKHFNSSPGRSQGGNKFRGSGGSGSRDGAPAHRNYNQGSKNFKINNKNHNKIDGNASFSSGGRGDNKGFGNRNVKNQFQHKVKKGPGFGNKTRFNKRVGNDDDSEEEEEKLGNPNFIQVKRQDKKNKSGVADELEVTSMIEQFKSFKEIKTFEDDDDESDDEDDFTKGANEMGAESSGLGPKGSKKKTGGFQSMGLSPLVLKGVLRRGYKVPTPIQRKVA